MEKNYIEVKNKYLAEGLAFLGFKYYKNGFGRDTRYSFEDTKNLQIAFDKLIEMKKELNLI